VLTTGFDERTIETIVVNRATKSLPLWLQMTGRGGRIAEGKSQFTILDMGSNVIAGGHGLWEQERDWEHLFKNPGKQRKTEGGAAFKECPKCENLLAVSVRKCSNCGHEFPQETKELKETELVEVDSEIGKIPKHLRKPKSQMTVLELMERAQYGSSKLGRPYKTGWIVHELRQRGEGALREYAQIMGYKDGWIQRQMEYA